MAKEKGVRKERAIFMIYPSTGSKIVRGKKRRRKNDGGMRERQKGRGEIRRLDSLFLEIK